MATTARGYPYPLGTDRLMDGDDAIHSLATAIETHLGGAACGIATLPAPSGVNTPTTLAVTFPAGRFTTAPVVVASPNGGAPQVFAPCSSASVTATGCVLYGARVSGGMATIVTNWYAVQIP